MDILAYQQMAHLTPEQQAKEALTHLIHQMRSNLNLYRQIGMGTQTFSLVTEAASALYGEENPKKLRESILEAPALQRTPTL